MQISVPGHLSYEGGGGGVKVAITFDLTVEFLSKKFQK